MVIQIKARTGDIIFEYDKENNTIKDTVEEAVKNCISLFNANLKGANLEGADLRGADFNNSYLRDINLKGANLRCANFRYVDLSYADLKGVDLSNADLYNANLVGTNLHNANLKGANLSCANLYCANLESADLSGANLYDAYLYNAKNIPDGIPIACPESGSFIGWKKVRYEDYEYLVKLEIPADAKRCSATSKKCRCDKAKVLEITNIYTNENVKEVTNYYNYTNCIYRVGEMVYPDFFDENRWIECSHGIHFFMDEQNAIDY